MATLQKKEECGNGPKKSFAPPTQKLQVIPQGPNSPQEYMTLGVRTSEGVTETIMFKTKLAEEEKAITENRPNSGWEIKGKAQDKPMEKKKKEKTTLTNAEFEEIVQIVLQKSLQDCLGHCQVWVQCSLPHCEKWRQLSGDIDPSILPDNWICDQNPDLAYNRCDIPEEAWTESESEVAYASYVPGSMIWAKQYGYPWWPGMVESDPDLGEYFIFASHLDHLPSKYHVTFFGDTVSRAWIPINMLKNFQELSLELIGVKKYKNKDYSQKLVAAIMMAHKAQQVDILARVNLFGFWNRYGRSDNSGGKKEVMLSKANNPESVLKKKKEKRKKKNPTLPGPRSAKKQTKKSKPTGMADEQDRPPKKRMKSRSLDNECVDAPVSIIKKEEPRNPDQPGEAHLATIKKEEEPRNLDQPGEAHLATIKKEEEPRNLDQPGQAHLATIKKEEEPRNLDQPGCKKKFQAPQSKAPAPRLSKEKVVRMVSQGLAPPACHEPCPLMGKAWPAYPELLAEAVIHAPPEDRASSDLDLEQLMEDIGREAEEQGELQPRDSAETFPMAFWE
ncbi:zinc finger CW-type PWWP domain protein 1 [Perognathus longimembris pacificus]|uniref:zinc finger CW-type PWWP domain protein 1 n=1 Tax=Perognathus longimembris pacificus TaxID=214514 RepID=UPI002019F3EF|nr:zinc finger CW-type PWWP domain protein 1 [Perognathus longimembris pacificus]